MVSCASPEQRRRQRAVRPTGPGRAGEGGGHAAEPAARPNGKAPMQARSTLLACRRAHGGSRGNSRGEFEDESHRGHLGGMRQRQNGKSQHKNSHADLLKVSYGENQFCYQIHISGLALPHGSSAASDDGHRMFENHSALDPPVAGCVPRSVQAGHLVRPATDTFVPTTPFLSEVLGGQRQTKHPGAVRLLTPLPVSFDARDRPLTAKYNKINCLDQLKKLYSQQGALC